jgi:hypothetical protein
VKSNEKKGGEFFIWNKKTSTIRSFANSGFALAVNGNDIIIKPYTDEPANVFEYVKETYQLRNPKLNKCIQAENKEEGKMTAATCNYNNPFQKFYPFYTYQVTGSYHHRLQNE